MKIIVIDGINNVGVNFQSSLLAKRLLKLGYKVAYNQYQYHDQSIRTYIMNGFLCAWEADQYTLEHIMAVNKHQQNRLSELEKEGYDYIILARYILYQFAFSKAKGIPYLFQEASTILESMRKSDIEIVVDIPAEVYMKEYSQYYNGVFDCFECNPQILTEARENLIILPDKLTTKQKFIIDGLKSNCVIHEEIYDIVRDNLIYI